MAKEKIGLNKVFEESLKDSQPLHGLSETYKANFKSESEELQLYFDDNSDGRSKRSTPQHNLEISATSWRSYELLRIMILLLTMKSLSKY